MRALFLLFTVLFATQIFAQPSETLLLQQPDMNATHSTFIYAGDVWIIENNAAVAQRITNTAAVESDPHLSPDGKELAFTSNRSGAPSVYAVSIAGGEPRRLTYHPAGSYVRGWTNDGQHIYYASGRESAPAEYYTLWKVQKDGGPELRLTNQWAYDAVYSPDGQSMAIDRITRWDKEWRVYRGGQNTALSILNMSDLSEELLPNKQTTDINPVWLDQHIFFISDRDSTMNIWSYDLDSKKLAQCTNLRGADIKSMTGHGNQLLFERNGGFYLYNIKTKAVTERKVKLTGDFPWMQKKWEDVSKRARSVSLSPTGKRAIMEARGEIFTVPIKHGDARNISNSSAAADRRPIWSPKGDKIAWFTDANKKNYVLRIANQDGHSDKKDFSIGASKLGWEPCWSPDGKYIAFVDDDLRVRLVNLSTGSIETIDMGGINIERGFMDLSWSPDSKRLAYSKTSPNNFKRIFIWSMDTKKAIPVTNEMAHSMAPAWDRNGKHLYFMSTTNLALGSGWANTSSMMSDPSYSCYVINLRKSDPSPFDLRSDEEEVKADEASVQDDKKEKKKNKKKSKKDKKSDEETIKIDFENIALRTIPIPMPTRHYGMIQAGPEGSFFVGEYIDNARGMTIHKFDMEERESKVFAEGLSQFSVSADGKQAIARKGRNWQVFGTAGAKGKGKGLAMNLKMHLDRKAEWKQILDEAWRYQRDYFYDKNMHGRNWERVYQRYIKLLPYIKHRSALHYILDQMNGELSVGHSFVYGGDYPKTESYPTGLLGANMVIDQGRWKIARIFTAESWNPNLSSPLSKPGIKLEEGYYIVGINNRELTAQDNIFEALQGTSGKQTSIHVNKVPSFSGSWVETIKPIGSERSLRQRAWVEDNRRKVDALSGGKLAYVWVPNTSGAGFNSFNRYLFAQQDKQGAVIDERFNGGGLLDDYMVDLLTRKLRAAITNEVEGQPAFKLPAGIHGPKVLLVNEMAGSGGDYFPWVFKQQKAGKVIGQTTWGGLVKSSRHYGFIDGSSMTAPDNAVYDPINKEWIGENIGIDPDIYVRQDAKALEQGGDPQLERAVELLLKELKNTKPVDMTPPAYPKPGKLD